MKLDHKFILSLLETLVNIKSISGTEYDIMLYLEKKIKSWGIKTTRFKFGNKQFNLLARYGKGSPILCLNSHADTVPQSGNSKPCATIKNGILYGLGACDTKASLAAMMGVLKNYVVSQKRLNGTLDLLISVDEERTSKGVHSAITQNYKCDYAVVGEPTNFEIITHHMGQIMLSIQSKGRAVHSSTPWKGINAIDKLLEVINSIRSLIIENEESLPGIGRQSMNLGAIHGGDIANRVPDSCEALIDIRILPGKSTDDTLEKIMRIFKQNKNIRYTVLKNTEPMKLSGNSSFVELIKDEVRKAIGKRAITKGARFWTEGADFRNGLNAQTVVLGPGDVRQAHSENEFVRVKDVLKAAEIYSSIVSNILSKACSW